MSECNHIPPKSYHCVPCLLAEIVDLKNKLNRELSVRQMTVQRIKGKVDGHPTHQDNFLQRIDQLTLIEAKVLMHSMFSSDPNMVSYAKRILEEEDDDAFSG